MRWGSFSKGGLGIKALGCSEKVAGFSESCVRLHIVVYGRFKKDTDKISWAITDNLFYDIRQNLTLYENPIYTFTKYPQCMICVFYIFLRIIGLSEMGHCTDKKGWVLQKKTKNYLERRTVKKEKRKKKLTWEQSNMTSSTTEVLDFIHTRPVATKANEHKRTVYCVWHERNFRQLCRPLKLC